MTVNSISPSQIQAELSRIWDALEGSNKMRASLFNLIFVTTKKPRSNYIKAISQKVIEKFPSRIIFITINPEDSASYLYTKVSVLSSNQGEFDIVCDSIEIESAQSEEERAFFVLLPHLLPDLPIYVIWAEDPMESKPLFQKLYPLASRVIFDSETIMNLGNFSKTLLDFHQNSECDIADLNWGRIESWRELLASTFYSTEQLATLKKSSKIQILYNAQASIFCSHTQIQAIYLQGWLATQLGWKIKKISTDAEKMSILYSKEIGDVEITLYPEKHESLKPGAILSVDIHTEDQNHFSFGRNLENPHHVSMRLSTLEKCTIPLKYIFAKDESGQSLVKEICRKQTSQHFLNLLKTMKDRKEFTFYES